MAADTELEQKIAGGGYAKKQIGAKDRLIAWSHGARFRKAREVVAPYAGKKLLDHGCGDGTFLARVSDLFPDAVGADVAPAHIADNQQALGDVKKLKFVLEDVVFDGSYDHTFDVITCMETLEHCTIDKIETLIDAFARLLKPDGVLIISVPIEIGPSLLGKELGRTIAGWKGVGDYRTKERYKTGELLKMLFAGPGTTLERIPHQIPKADGTTIGSHGHKGFNWKTLVPRLERKFRVGRPDFTPLGWTRGLFSSQVWLTCRPKA